MWTCCSNTFFVWNIKTGKAKGLDKKVFFSFSTSLFRLCSTMFVCGLKTLYKVYAPNNRRVFFFLILFFCRLYAWYRIFKCFSLFNQQRDVCVRLVNLVLYLKKSLANKNLINMLYQTSFLLIFFRQQLVITSIHRLLNDLQFSCSFLLVFNCSDRIQSLKKENFFSSFFLVWNDFWQLFA